MPLNLESYDTLVSNQVAAIQASSSQFLDFDPGSVILSLVEANTSAVGLFIEALLTALLATTRAASSNGTDLDSWYADFSFTRLPAVAATGQVTFARFTNTIQGVVPIGAIVQNVAGTDTYSVIIDTTNVNYNAGLGGYVLTAGTSSINIPVQANIPGTIGNASIGAINTLGSAIPYVDTVTNALAFTTGVDAESDAAFRARFVLYLASLARATKAAILYAVSLVQQNLICNLAENVNYNGSSNPGYFTAVIDDGTHAPPTQLLTNVGSSIEQYRGFCITYGVFAPTTLTVNVALTITTTASVIHSQIVTLVTNALTKFLNTQQIGQTLYYTSVYEVVYDVDPSIIDVTAYTLNSGTADIVPNAVTVIIPGTVTVT